MNSHNSRQANIGGLDIPTHDAILNTYHGATNNIATTTYYKGGLSGQVVATLTLSYVGGVPAADDADLLSVVKTPL